MKLSDYITCIKEGKVPRTPPIGLVSMGYSLSKLDCIEVYKARTECTSRGLWFIVDKMWTGRLAAWIGHKKCLEVMAGAGWLSKALTEHGVDIVATDDFSWDKPHKNLQLVHDVKKMSAIDSVEEYGDREVLISSWPPYDDDTICSVGKRWGNSKPIVYIGEGEGGCCASMKFWRNYELIEHEKYNMVSWDGIHDYVEIGYYTEKVLAEEFEVI